MTETQDGQVSLFDQDTWYGKTSSVPCPATKGATSQRSSKKRSASQSRKPPIFQCLKRDGLHTEDSATWTDDGLWLGAYSMLNTGECPNVAVESRLSQILKARPHTKYSLSPKACEGILRRAERRGKDLPSALKAALLAQSASVGAVTEAGKELFTGCLTPYGTQANRVYGNHGVFPPLQAREKSGLNRESVFCLQGNGIDRADTAGCNGKGWREDVSYTLNTVDRPAICAAFKLGNSETARSIGFAEEQAPTLNAECGGNKPAVMVFDTTQITSKKNGSKPEYGKPCHTLNAKAHPPCVTYDMSHANDVIRECGDVVPTLQSRMGTGGNQVPLTYQMQGFGDYREGDVASSCKQRDFKDGTDLVCDADCRNFREGGEVSGTLQAKESGGQRLNLNNTVRQNMVVRRLTPTECERLQGFPDRWTDIETWTDEKGKLHKESSDSARYKALGNSIALPPWKWVLKRLCAQYERDATMGSLFDGIGGFPLIWIQLNGWNSVKWASEIEPFCIAVTKRHFGEGENSGDVWEYLTGVKNGLRTNCD